MTQLSSDQESEERARARKRVTDRREFGSHFVVYIVVNATLIFVWAVTGAGYFWPAWVLGLWASGLILHGWEAFVRRPVTDADIEAELHRRQR
jgi:hypothetical protein